jgi:hypothetical protein
MASNLLKAGYAWHHRHFLQGPGAGNGIRQIAGRAAVSRNVSQQVYQMARATGLGKEHGAAIVKIYEQLAGVTLGPR